MIRRILTSCALTACIGAVALANHPATFVLTSGERVSGELSYKGGTNYTLNGKDYPSDQIAIIEFAPGDPTAAELKQLPAVNNNPAEHERHVFVTRSGEVIFGKIYHISPDGNTITYDRREGGRHDLSADNLARVYVNPGSARTLHAAILNAPQAVATSGAMPAGAIAVNGNQAWTDTNINVKKGERIAFSTTGEIRVAAAATPENTATPDGAGQFPGARTSYPVPQMAAGGLIARVGNGAPFPIGSNTQPITMPSDGRLYLGINDDQVGDNSGTFAVTIRR
jgi:hypothetical protein